MIRNLLFLGLFFACSCTETSPDTATLSPLQVSPNGRYLQTVEGKPFFYLGDTAWELFHRLSKTEAQTYLSDRASKGFTVIQAVVLAELDGLHTPNAEGAVPLVNDDPTQWNEAYFAHVDAVVAMAADLDLYIGMLPTWGDKFNQKWGVGPEIFTPENARIFGERLGKRYQDQPIIWILGGDRNPENEEDLQIVRAMAEGLEVGHGGKQLMTYHPQGDFNSATWFHQDAWLDFNMFQSGHGSFNKPNYRKNYANYQLSPPKPTLDGEPRYEDHPVNWKPEEGWFLPFDVRQAAYWNVFSGACGHTYGNHNIWQMWQPDREPISSARTPWQQAMNQEGAQQMQHLRHLMQSRPWYEMRPDSSFLDGGSGQGASKLLGLMAHDQSFAMVYSPYGMPIRLTSFLPADDLAAYWYNPRDGQGQEALQQEAYYFSPPGGVKGGNDWVLVVEKKGRFEEAPGKP
ncbi:MAG: DUF4038 domain-containing protein [Bacteroidota bacterium]